MQRNEMKSPSRLPRPKRLPPDCLLKKLVGELVEGRGAANELLTGKSLTEEEVQVLARKIDSSFSNCLSTLDSSGDGDVLQSLKNSIAIRSCEFEDSGECSKNPTRKDRRGCHRRRKSCQVWIVDSPTEVADEYAWRKYGQKPILNAKYPRNYYRCSYKIDQGCKATKHVQQIADNPPVFRTTYADRHTCQTPLKPNHQIELDSPDKSEPSILLSFESNHSIEQSLNPLFSSFLNIKQEENKDEGFTREEIIMAQNHSPPSHHLPSPHLTALRSSGATARVSSLDYGDVISQAYSPAESPQSLYIDNYSMIAGSSVMFDEIETFQFQY
ncbi:hypothetical protein Nepgr_024969 [Nepenthes gracilis]|uniref:WRKY domain-containing protein n=1 Tax=Nepenthes gracilis TaxID=150966 RepID=A0AAD3T5U9_NEPGR|nr:hypothetical protein Nepgr_024969 [Nepenthes gracilis]